MGPVANRKRYLKMGMVVSKAQSNELTAQICLVLQAECLDQMAPTLRFELLMLFIINTERYGASSKPQEVPENGHGG